MTENWTTQACSPVDDTNLSGQNLEYDPLYLQLEELATSTPEQQMGDSVVEGRDPNWRQLRKQCCELWKRTRDLRVATYYTIAQLALEGLSGFAEGLELIQFLLTQQWDTFWPQLDPDDDNDPLERLNIITMLSPPRGAYDDPIHFLTIFRDVRLVPGKLTYTLRDFMIADGEIDSNDNRPDSTLLTAEMSAIPFETLQTQQALVERINALLTSIAEAFSEHASNYPVSFATLQEELKRLKRFYSRFIQLPEVEAPVPSATDATASAPVPSAEGVAATVAGLPAVLNVRNRSEALRLLRRACEYFQTAEPTSPVPFLINRAIRMADMNFIDLLTEIDANATERGRDILGIKPTDNDSE